MKFLSAVIIASSLTLSQGPAFAQSRLTTPEAFFGAPMGTDRKMYPWTKLVDYYRLLEPSSNRIKVVEIANRPKASRS